MALFTRNKTNQPEEKSLPTTGPVSTKATVNKDIAVGLTSFELFGLNRGSLTTKSRKLLEAYDGWVYANVKAIAQKVAEMEFKLYQTSFSKGEMVFNEIQDHPLLDLLDKFNAFTTKSDAVFHIDSNLLLAGDVFLLKQRSGREVTSLFVLDPTKITVNPGDVNDNYAIKSYLFQDQINGVKTEATYMPEDIVPIKETNPANPYRGKSTVEAAAQTIDTDMLAGQYNLAFFQNSAVPSVVLQTDQKLNEDQIGRLEKKLARNFGGVTKSNKTMIMGGGLKVSQVSTTAKDMEFNAQQEWTRDKIMALFGNTKTSLGITEDVNRANAEATLYGWLKHTIKPRMGRIVDSLNEYLVPEFGDNLVLAFEDPLPEDRNSLIDEVMSMVADKPIITVNEARQELEFDPLPNEDEIPTTPAPTFGVAQPADPKVDPDKEEANEED